MPALQDVGSPDRGVVLLDADYRITHANRRASEILGVPIDRLIGQELPEPLARRRPGPGDAVEEVLDGSLAAGTVFHRYSTPVFSADGRPAGRIEIYSDITARRGLEREILDRNRELAELNRQLAEAQEQLLASERLRTLGEMAAGVAHDINNVIGIILGNAQIARRKLGDSTDALACIDAIELAARDAAETVRRLREIGRPVNTAAYELVDLNEVVEDIVRTALPAWIESGSHGAQRIRVEKRLGEGCVVTGSPSELREMLANLLANAVQAIEQTGEIEIGTSRAEDCVDLAVRDSGAGMTEETRARLFDPFFTTRGAAGTGLGMSMVGAIAIRHGGRVIVDSEEGKGTTVTVRLPVGESLRR